MFENNEIINPKETICHSGGAEGSDTYFSTIGKEYVVITKAYSYKTSKHQSTDKVEISDNDFKEGIIEIKLVNKELGRFGIDKYMNLLARNWAQIKYSTETYAIGYIIEPKQKGIKGFYNKSNYQQIDGGTGYGVLLSIIHEHPTYIFDQNKNKWFEWSYIIKKYKEIEPPVIKTNNFAGIGTINITNVGIEAIKELYNKKTNYGNKNKINIRYVE